MTKTMNFESLLMLLLFWKYSSQEKSILRPRVNFCFTPLIADEKWPYTTFMEPSLTMV